MEQNSANARRNTADLSLAERLALAKEIVAELKKHFPGKISVPKAHSRRKLKSRSESKPRSAEPDVLTEKSASQKPQISKDRKYSAKWESELPFTPPTDRQKPTKMDQLREKLVEEIRSPQQNPSIHIKLPKEVESYFKNLHKETVNEEEDAEDEFKGMFTSAAETFRKKLVESETVFPLLRVVIIGSLNFIDNKEENIKSLFQDSVDRINTEKPFATFWNIPQEQKDALFGGWILLSGYLICYGCLFLHYIEGPEYFLKLHVEDLLNEIQSPASKLKRVKLLQTSDMFVKRSFPRWIYLIIKGPTEDHNFELKGELDGCLSLIEECRLKIHVTGAVVQKYMEDSLSEEEIKEHLRKIVPNSSMLKTLLRMKILPSLDYYVDIYQDRGPIILPEESTWTKFDDKNIYKMIEEESDEEEWKEFEAELKTLLADTS